MRMKDVTPTRQKSITQFRHIDYGETFMLDSHIYMKITEVGLSGPATSGNEMVGLVHCEINCSFADSEERERVPLDVDERLCIGHAIDLSDGTLKSFHMHTPVTILIATELRYEVAYRQDRKDNSK